MGSSQNKVTIEKTDGPRATPRALDQGEQVLAHAQNKMRITCGRPTPALQPSLYLYLCPHPPYVYVSLLALLLGMTQMGATSTTSWRGARHVGTAPYKRGNSYGWATVKEAYRRCRYQKDPRSRTSTTGRVWEGRE